MTKHAQVRLLEVTRENVDEVLDLQLHKDQEQFVASNAVSIAQAHFYQDITWFKAAYVDGVLVGFVLVVEDPENTDYSIWRMMVDKRFQHQGIGRGIIQAVVEELRSRIALSELTLSCVSDVSGPKSFYERVGFIDTGKKTKMMKSS